MRRQKRRSSVSAGYSNNTVIQYWLSNHGSRSTEWSALLALGLRLYTPGSLRWMEATLLGRGQYSLWMLLRTAWDSEQVQCTSWAKQSCSSWSTLLISSMINTDWNNKHAKKTSIDFNSKHALERLTDPHVRNYEQLPSHFISFHHSGHFSL